MTRRCSRCGREMEHVVSDLDTGVVGHWYCECCDATEHDHDDYDYDGD
jgi:hypothetical protein